MVGHSTDGEGFLAALDDEAFPVEPGLTAMVLGAGGAGMSVAHALLGRGAKVILANRDRERLRTASARLSAAPPSGGFPAAADARSAIRSSGACSRETGLLVGAMSRGIASFSGGLDLGGLPARGGGRRSPLSPGRRRRSSPPPGRAGSAPGTGSACSSIRVRRASPCGPGSRPRVAAMARAAGYTRLDRGLQAR